MANSGNRPGFSRMTSQKEDMDEETRRANEIVRALEAPERPTDEVVSRMHAELLIAMAIPDTAKQRLNEQPINKQWELIKMNAQLLRDKASMAALSWNKEKRDLLKQIDSSLLPNLEAIAALYQSLRQAPRQMLRGFFRDDGLSVILRSIQRRLVSYPRSAIDTIACREYLMCLKVIGNTAEGMDILLDHPEAIDTIVFCLDFEWSSNACLVLEILSVVTHYSDKGRTSCCSSLLRLSRRRLEPPFFYLVCGLKSSSEGSVKVKAEISTFVNVLIQCTSEIEIRNQIRNSLLSFEYICILHRSWHDEQMLKGDLFGKTSNKRSSASTADLLGLADIHSRASAGWDPNSTGQRISMSRASLLKAVDEYAEDGKTIINPENGHMAGNCIAVKNRDRTTQKVASIFGSKSTKHRWYEIKNGLLKWWSEKKKSDEPDGIIDASEFIGINMTSDDPELLKSTSFGFEVVMKDRIIVLGCTSEEDRIKWTTALLMSFNSAVIKKYRHNVSKAIKLTDQQEKDCLRRLETELKIFEMLWKVTAIFR